jgi:hypothetical protein
MPSYLVKCFRIKHEKININTSAKDDDDIFLTLIIKVAMTGIKCDKYDTLDVKGYGI